MRWRAFLGASALVIAVTVTSRAEDDEKVAADTADAVAVVSVPGMT